MIQNAPELETDRLRLRQWREDDIESVAAILADEQSARFLGGICSRDQAWRRMATLVGHWTLRGFGYWAVEVKQTAAFVGGVGLWFPDGWPELELGYWLMPEMQGKGYATEAALAARNYAFEVLEAETIVSYIDPNNEASKRLAERMGAVAEKTIKLLDYGPHVVYRHARSTLSH